MKIVGCMACLIAALHSAEMAIGTAPDRLFSPDWFWVWWLTAFFWAVAAILFATGRRF